MPGHGTESNLGMKSSDTFDTPRMRADRLVADDLSHIARMYADERVMATLGGVRTLEQVHSLVAAHVEHWERNGFGFWMFRDRTDGAFVGRAGLRRVHVGGRDEVELGYALMPAYWGQGLATEMAEGCLRVGRDHLGLTNIVAYALPTNVASRRVMEKVGFVYERDIVHANLPHVLYRLRTPGIVDRRVNR